MLSQGISYYQKDKQYRALSNNVSNNIRSERKLGKVNPEFKKLFLYFIVSDISLNILFRRR